VLLILILGAWLAVVLFGLTLCRLATRSDESHALAMAEWVAATGRSGHRVPIEQPDGRHAAYRATG
jgi:hypothetical protein